MEKKQNQLRVLMVQYDIAWENALSNHRIIEDMIDGRAEDVDIVVLPESFNSGFSMNMGIAAQNTEGESVRWMKIMAKKYGFAICGSIFVQDGLKHYNRFIFVSPEGRVLNYDKRHVFAYGGENKFITPGSSRLVIDYLGWKIFPQICYDLRFPVWGRNNLDYDLFLNVANWPKARLEVWQTLLKARAIENQCYVLGVNRIGTDGEQIEYPGHSMAIDAKGNVIGDMGAVAGVVNIIFDYEALHQFRKKFNVLGDRDEFCFTS